jgi:hypothetical protein
VSYIPDLFEKLIFLHKNYEPGKEKDIQKLYDVLKEEIKKETDPDVIIEAINKDISDLMYLSTSFMFEVYQRAIELNPMNVRLIESFVDYVDIHSGPDWEVEVNQIRDLLRSNCIEKAAQVALQIDYNKWDKFAQILFHSKEK